ncbi:flagellar motor switch phosphatase FliY [Alicyclobacillus kakegawensis]|uniref:flagellar motor switch phosphatase FliY n=1 Tax=Alicyclobacillus kakegawensis TaxID=392012 RepID=UPI000831499E|nr:flagellar motor switch phosphatase FliY [Alicyclobacillus kakegawensis]
MTDHQKLSQAEIDALLQQASTASTGDGAPESDSFSITGEDMDVLGEIGNISFGAAATSLSTLLQQRVEITTPTVSLYQAENLRGEFPKPFVVVGVQYTEGLTGTNVLLVQLDDAKTIADLMLGGNGENVPDELNELHLSAVAEAMNQMMGGAATAMSQIFGRPINISPPEVQFVDLSSEEWHFGVSGPIVNVSFRMRVGTLIDSTIMQWLPLSFAKEMVNLVRSPDGSSDADEGAATEGDGGPSSPEPVGADGGGAQGAAQAAAAAASDRGAAAETAAAYAGPRPTQVNARPARVVRPEFVDLSAETAAREGEPRNLALLLDVPLHVTVELGRTKKKIGDILNWTQGTVVELDKLAGEPVDILVNNKRVATGEVVVIDENFGVRVTEIISPSDRVRKLQ